MQSRERVNTALNHKNPDRVPTFFRRYSPPGYELSEEKMRYIYENTDIGPYLELKNPKWFQKEKEATYYDELGVGRRFTGLYWNISDFPLSNMEFPEELEEYPWPDLTEQSRAGDLRNDALTIIEQGKAVAVMGSWGGSTGIFEQSWYMRGMENFLKDLMINIPFAEALMYKQLELHKARWRMILDEVGDLADIVCTGDDLATQSGLLLSPAKYRDLVKPFQKELICFIKKHTDAKIYYHSCGAVEPLISDLIDIGVEILDPVQPLALNTRELKEKYGEKLTFYGGIDVQKVLPCGTSADVKAEVFRRFEEMGGNGGLILGPSHWIQIDVPWENIHAMYEALQECRY